MFSKLSILAVAGIAGFGGFFCRTLEGQDLSDQPLASENEAGELGLNLFGFSLHANRSAGYNEVNPGVGLRDAFWHPAPDWTVFGDASIYYDSRRHWAKYVALAGAYRFADSWSVGVGVGYAQSQTYNHGKPFLALVPGVGFEYHGVTLNAVLLPSESSTSRVAGVAFFATVPLVQHR